VLKLKRRYETSGERDGDELSGLQRYGGPRCSDNVRQRGLLPDQPSRPGASYGSVGPDVVGTLAALKNPPRASELW
jgi:hypothetical protein